MTMKRFSTLNIDYVQAEHRGQFTCTAKNPAGDASYSAYLNVNGTGISTFDARHFMFKSFKNPFDNKTIYHMSLSTVQPSIFMTS